MVINYNKLPSSVDTISDLFLEGIFYGRLRTNMFVWNWKKENYPDGKLMDDKAMGVGGSFILSFLERLLVLLLRLKQ
jgi:hypothetical protein